MQNRASEKMQNGSCDAVIAAASSFAAVSARTQRALNSDVRDLHVMKQVHKNACVTNVPFNQFCLPGEVEKGVEFVTVAGPKREKKEKDTIKAILTLRQSLRQTSGPTEKEAAWGGGCLWKT